MNPYSQPSDRELQTELLLSAAILETVGALVVVLDSGGRIVRFNAQCERVTGYRAEEVRGRCFWDFLLPSSAQAGVRETFARLHAGDFPNHYENPWLTRGGEERLIAWTNTALISPDGRVEYVVCTGLDVTEQRQMEAQLRESEERFRVAFGRAPIGMALISPAGEFLRVNQALCDLLGYCEGDMLEKSIQEVTHPEDLPSDLHLMKRVLSGDLTRYTLEKRYLRSDGAIIPGQLSVALVRDGSGAPQYFISQVEDISHWKQHEARLEDANAQLERLARLDPLTGTLNRRGLMEMLQSEWDRTLAQGQPLSFAMLDVDHFKVINDRHGHAAGDQVLQTVARVILRETRTSDIVARYGGEEFALILPESGMEGAYAVAERIRRTVEHTSRLPQAMTVSLGVAEREAWMTSPAELLAAADAALYRSKRTGRNRTTAADAAAARDSGGDRSRQWP